MTGGARMLIERVRLPETQVAIEGAFELPPDLIDLRWASTGCQVWPSRGWDAIRERLRLAAWDS
jgi:hypothetical protein